MSSPTQTPAGWYLDGTDPRHRYWDGTAWTDHFGPAAPVIAPRPRRSGARVVLLVLAILLLPIVIIGGFFAAQSMLGKSITAGGGGISVSTDIVYSVTGAGFGSVTYLTASGGKVGQESANHTALPWSKNVSVSTDLIGYTALTLVAVGDAETTSISCSITQDGKVVAEQTSTGRFATVTCNSTNR